METKRRGPQKKTGKTTKPFRAPRRRQSAPSVIPGLLKQKGVEKKVLFSGDATTGSGDLALNSTGNIYPLNLIQTGSSMYNRIGRRIEMVSLRFTGNLFALSVTRAAIMDLARIAIVYDRQTNGATPTISDVFQDTDQAGTNTTSSMSGINMNNRERFVVLMDKRILLPQATDTATVLTNTFPNSTEDWVHIDEFRKLRGLTTHYKADSNPAVVGDISTGGLFIIGFAGLPAGGEIFSLPTWNCRLKYIDV